MIYNSPAFSAKAFILAWLYGEHITVRDVYTFHHADITQIPQGYYAVVTVEVKKLEEIAHE